MHKVRYFTKESLVSAAKQADANDVNRRVDVSRLEKMLEKDMLYPIIFALVHNETEMRCRVAVNAQGESVFLDVPIETWQNLPLQEVEKPAFVEADSTPVS